MQTEDRLEDNFVERELTLGLLESGYTQIQTAFIVGKSESLVKIYKRGFRNATEYEMFRVRQLTNPETSKPFKSLVEYQAQFSEGAKWRAHGKRISDLADISETEGSTRRRLGRTKPEGEVTRKIILDYITTNPGAHFRAIMRALDLNIGTMQYHLYVLENQKAIESVRTTDRLYYFPKGHEIKIPSNERQIRIVEAIATNQNIRQDELGELLGITCATVIYHASNLEKLGLIAKEKHGREVRYRVNVEGA